jgi:2-haloacid dehalogenase
MRYRTLLFDLDLTLFDFAASERLAFAECADAAGLPTSPEVFDRYKVINGRLWAGVERGELTPAEAGRRRFDELLDEFGASGATADVSSDELGQMFQHGLGAHGELYPEADAVLDAIASKAELALVTNGLTTVQRAKVARLGLDRWFDPIVISDEVGLAKPDPAIFDLTLDELDRVHGARGRRSQTVMIGDSLTSDMAGAQAAGIATCWFNPAGADRPASVELTHECRSLLDLIDTLSV